MLQACPIGWAQFSVWGTRERKDHIQERGCTQWATLQAILDHRRPWRVISNYPSQATLSCFNITVINALIVNSKLRSFHWTPRFQTERAPSAQQRTTASTCHFHSQSIHFGISNQQKQIKAIVDALRGINAISKFLAAFIYPPTASRTQPSFFPSSTSSTSSPKLTTKHHRHPSAAGFCSSFTPSTDNQKADKSTSAANWTSFEAFINFAVSDSLYLSQAATCIFAFCNITFQPRLSSSPPRLFTSITFLFHDRSRPTKDSILEIRSSSPTSISTPELYVNARVTKLAHISFNFHIRVTRTFHIIEALACPLQQTSFFCLLHAFERFSSLQFLFVLLHASSENSLGVIS